MSDNIHVKYMPKFGLKCSNDQLGSVGSGSLRSSLSEASTRSVSGLLGKMKESLAEHGLFPSRHSAYRGKAAALHQSLYLIKGSLSTGGAAALAWN